MPILNLSFKSHVGWVLMVLCLLGGCTGTQKQADPVGVAESKQRARQAVEELFSAYEDKDLMGLLDRVSPDYLGNRAELERDLDDQLRQVDSIDYEWFISRVRPSDEDQTIDVRFRWDRRWRDVDTGAETRQSGTTTFRLTRSNGIYRLKNIQGTNPFL